MANEIGGFDPQIAVEVAKGMMQAANVLTDAAYADLKDIDQVDQTISYQLMGFMGASATASMQALEIILKSFLMREKGESSRSHDVEKLFCNLPQTVQDEVEEAYAKRQDAGPSAQRPLSLHELLASTRDMLIRHRYFYEEIANKRRGGFPVLLVKRAFGALLDVWETDSSSELPHVKVAVERVYDEGKSKQD